MMNEPTKTLAALIIEDVESDAQLIVRLLKKAGYALAYERVETAGQMRAALEKQTWDIIISDYKMPQFDGRAALLLLQETGQDIPFIVLSGTIGEETAVAMMKAGAHDYLVKGDLARLIPAVERELEQSKIRRQRRQADDALRELEERYRSLFDRMTDGMYLSTHAGKFVDVNPAMVKMFGYSSKAEMLAVDIKNELYFAPDERGRHILDTGQRELEVYRMRRKDGSEIWVEDSGSYIHDEQGGITFHEGIMRDVTGRVQAEKALRASEERFRSVFENATIGLYRATPDGHILLANTTFARMLGCESIAELIEHYNDDDLVTEYAHNEFLQIMESKGDVKDFEAHWKRRDGTVVYVRENAKAVRDNNGEILYHEGAVEDITGRVQAEKALRASDERFRALYDNVTIGLYRTTPDGRILMLNPAGVQMLGYVSFDEIAQWNLEQAGYEPDYSRKEFREKLERESVVIGWESKWIKKDGSEIFMRESAKVFRDENGEVLYYDGSFEDITAYKQAEESLRMSEARYRELFNGMLDGFALHEIICDANGQPVDYRFLEVNLAFERLTGLQAANLIGKTVLEVLPNTESYWIEIYGNVALTGRSTFFENYSKEIGRYFEVSAYCPRPGQFAVIMMDITERKRTEEDIHQRVTELEMLYQSGLALGQLLNPKEIGQKILELLEEKLGWYHVIIRLYNKQNGTLEMLAYDPSGAMDAKEQRALEEHRKLLVIRPGHGISGWAFQHGQIIRSGNLQADPRFLDNFPGMHSGLYVPMKAGQHVIGVIGIESEQPNAFSEADERLVTTLANQAASAFENARLFEETHQRVTELEMLYQSGLALGQLLNPQEIGQKILELLEEKLDWHHTIIRLYHPQDESLELLAFNQPGLDGMAEERAVAERFNKFITTTSEGLSGWAVQQSQATRSGDVRSNPHYKEVYPAIRSGLYTPIKLGNRILGVISIESEQPDAFSDADERLVATLANQAASAFENARLFEETRQRVRELEMLYQSGLALGQLLNPQEIGQKILELLEEKLDWHHSVIRLYHPQDDRLEMLAFSTPGKVSEAERNELEKRFNKFVSKSGEGLGGWAVQQSQTIRSGDVRSNPHYREVYPGINSGLYTPIKLGGRMIGLIAIESEQPDAFSEADERLIVTLANQAASAFENARLFEETRQRVSELEMLYQSGLALSQLLNPKEIGQKILELLQEKLDWHRTSIIFRHSQDDSLELLDFNQPGLKSETERLEMVERLQTLVTRYMSAWAVQQGRPVRAGDVNMDARYIESYSGIRSGLYVPMKLGENILGVISIEDEQPDAFSDADERLVITLANQAASAFENARLFEETRQRVMELETLNRISLSLRAVSSQVEMLDIVLDEALAILNTSHGSIELWDEAGGNLLKTITRGWLAEVTEPPQNSGEGIVGKVYASGEAYITREFASDPVTRAAVRSKIPPGWGGICLPIHTAQQTLGVMIVSMPGGRELNKDEMRLLSTLAEMTGSALHRMQLFEETARRAEEFASLYETSKTLSAENDLNTLLQSIVEHAQALLHSAASGIYFYDEQHQEVELAVYTGPYVSVGTRLKLGESVAGRVAQTHQLLRVDDYSIWEGRSAKFAGVPFRAMLDVPMLYRGELIGVLTVDEISDSERKFSEADERLLSLFASQAAGAIHSARLHEETVQRLEHLQSLRTVDQAIASSLDMRLTLDILLTHTLPQLGVDAADVLLLYPDSNLLEVAASRGFRTRLLENVTVTESFAGRAIMEHRAITTIDIEPVGQHPQFEKFWKEEGFSAYWCVPLTIKGEARGVLEVYGRTAFTPNPEWIEFLETLAGQAAIAIENTQLFENLQHANLDLSLAYNATIEGWSRAMDLRDKETEGHTQRVADLTMAIAKAMGIKDQEMLHIRRGALLHDIGKMGIPDHILLKPDKLTDEEWVIMRTHPLLAHDMLMPIAYLREALDIPYSHHEKWDGTGYPQGLKGQQIPLAARFFAIVDVWDALTSDRPYRKKWTKKKTLAYIREQSGKHFDPQVVDAFERIIKGK